MKFTNFSQADAGGLCFRLAPEIPLLGLLSPILQRISTICLGSCWEVVELRAGMQLVQGFDRFHKVRLPNLPDELA